MRGFSSYIEFGMVFQRVPKQGPTDYTRVNSRGASKGSKRMRDLRFTQNSNSYNSYNTLQSVVDLCTIPILPKTERYNIIDQFTNVSERLCISGFVWSNSVERNQYSKQCFQILELLLSPYANSRQRCLFQVAFLESSPKDLPAPSTRLSGLSGPRHLILISEFGIHPNSFPTASCPSVWTSRLQTPWGGLRCSLCLRFITK